MPKFRSSVRAELHETGLMIYCYWGLESKLAIQIITNLDSIVLQADDV